MANKIKPARGVKNRVETVKETLEPYELIISTDTEQIGYKKSNNEVAYMANEKNVQEKLVSGVNIKTVGGQSLLGSGNIPIPSTEEFASKQELNGKLDKVSSTSTYNQAYVKLANGKQSIIDIADSPIANTIASRGLGGVIKASNAVSTNDAIPLGQADGRYVRKEISLAVGTDLNTITETGFYYLMGGHTNIPSGGGIDFGQMIVSRAGYTFAQIIISYDQRKFWYRSGLVSNIGQAVWTRLANENDLDWTLIATNNSDVGTNITIPSGYRELYIFSTNYTPVLLSIPIINSVGRAVQSLSAFVNVSNERVLNPIASWYMSDPTTLRKQWVGGVGTTGTFYIYGR